MEAPMVQREMHLQQAPVGTPVCGEGRGAVLAAVEPFGGGALVQEVGHW